MSHYDNGTDLLVTSINSTQGRRLAHRFSETFNIMDYGAKSDGMNLSDITTTNGINSISSASYSFISANSTSNGDIGKLITIAGASSTASNNILNAIIINVNNGNAILSVAPTVSLNSNGVSTFGTDDTLAIQAAVNQASLTSNVFGGKIIIPAAITICSTILWATNISMFGHGPGKSVLKHIMTSDATVGMIYNTSGTGLTDCHFKDFTLDMSAATATSGYQVLASTIRISSTYRLLIENVVSIGSPATAFALDFATQCKILNNTIINAGRLNGGTNLGGAAIGCGVNTLATQSWTVIGNYITNPCTYAILFEQEIAGTTFESNVIVNENIIILASTSVNGIGDCGSRRFICQGNKITCSTGNSGDAITVKSGTTGYDPGNVGIISDNMISAVGENGITIDYTVGIPSGQKCAYTISRNQIQSASAHGIKIIANASTVLDTLIIEDNKIFSSSFTGMIFTGAGGIKDLIITKNKIFNNGGSGSGITAVGVAFLCAVTNLRMLGNVIFDNGTGTQKYAIGVNTSTALSGVFIEGNDLRFNNTGPINLIAANSTIAGWISNNPGYNPQGPVVITAGASPWTYTANSSPETLYVWGTTAISNVVKNSITLQNTGTSASINLQPGEQVIFTFTNSSAIFATADRR